MNCRNARRAIHQRIDDEIAPRDELALMRHLVECMACRTLADDLVTLRFDLRRIDRLDPLPTAVIRYGDRTVAHPVPGPKRLLRLGVAAAAAVVALCILRPVVPTPTRPEPLTAAIPPSVPEAPSAVLALSEPTDRIYMAIPLASRSKRVHIWWLYPRVSATPLNDSLVVDPELTIEGETQ